jgi:hypothetical protein
VVRSRDQRFASKPTMCSGMIGCCWTWMPSGRTASFTAVQIAPGALRPARMAQRLAPLPRWATIIRPAAGADADADAKPAGLKSKQKGCQVQTI